MKNILIKIGCVMACTSLLTGCSTKPTEPTEEFEASFIQEDGLESINPNNVQNNSENEEGSLVFGEHTYNDSVQINQKDLGWATYDTIPNDIFLMNFAYFPCDSVCQMPEWETELIDNLAISKKDNNVIAVSIVRMTDIPETYSLTDELFQQLKTQHGVTSFEIITSDVEEQEYQYWSIAKGTLNEQENLQYIVKTFNDGEFGYLLYAQWDTNDIYTEEKMEQTLQEIRATFNLYPITEDSFVEEIGEASPTE